MGNADGAVGGAAPIAETKPAGHNRFMTHKRGGMTLKEANARLASDPIYQAVRHARDQALADVARQRTLEQKELVRDLAAAGVTVDWVGDLLNMAEPDPRIYPVLVDHLSKPYSPWLLDWIGRAFGRKTARPIVWDTLIDLIKRRVLEQPAVAGLMAAISDIAQPGDVATMIDLLGDTSIGSSRVFLVRNLMRSKRPEARAALVRYQADPDLTLEITARLSRRRT